MALTSAKRRLLSRGVTGLAFLIGAVFFVRLWASYGSILPELDITPKELLAIALIPVAMYAVVIERSRVLLAIFKVKAALFPLTVLNTAAQAVGQLVPGGVGTELVFRTFSFARAGVPLYESAMVNALDGFVRLVTNTVALFFAATYFLLTNMANNEARLIVIAGFLFSLFGLVILLVILLGGADEWFIAMLKRVSGQKGEPEIDGRIVDIFRHHRGPFLVAALLSTVGFILEPLQLLAIVKVAGFDLPLWAVFWLTQAIALPRSLPVPGGLGLVEEASVQFSRLIGFAGGVGFAATILWRLRLIPYILVGLIFIPFLGYVRLIKERSRS